MNEKKQKRIRAFLINFVNEELNRKKRNNKNDILINSTSLDVLAEKNMQCKIFLVKEDNYFYQQNVEIGWIMGINFDINNSYHQKPLIDLFANKVTQEINKIDSSDNDEEKIGIVNKETIIKKNIDRVLFIHQERTLGSSLGTSLFQKKEISERKFNKENNDYYSGRVSNFHLNLCDKEKEDIKLKDNNSNVDENVLLIKRYSNITLETELSRIIKCCHEEDYSSSQEHCISESRRSELNKELKIARMYAKRLNLYCKNLKKKISRKYLNCKNINKNKKIKNYPIKNEDANENEDMKGNRVKSHQIKKIKIRKLISKRHVENENISKFQIIEKKTKTNKIISDNFRNNILESSSHIKGNITSREETANKNKKRVLKINNQYKKRNSSTFRNKLISNFKQVFFKSPKKGEVYKKKKTKQIGEREYKKININQKKLNDALHSNKEEDHLKKIIKMKQKPEYKNDKTSNFRISKFKYGKRASMVDKMNHTGLEKINFFKNKTKSTLVPYAIKAIKKNSRKKKDRTSFLNNINNKSTSISQRKDTSDSSEIILKDNDKKNNNKIKFSKKNSTQLMKRKKDNLVIEHLKKAKKRKSNNYDNIKIHKLKRISPLKIEREKRNHTIEKSRQKFGKLHEFNDINVSDFDDFNLIDEFLYKIKLKRSKNCNLIGMN